MVDNNSTILNEPVEFTFAGCLNDYENVYWDFGDGANPESADNIGPHEVYYETEGYKTVTLTIDEHSKTRENVVEVDSEDIWIGDVNGDGIINILDVVLLISYILDPDNPPAGFYENVADVNNDGEINVMDIVSLAEIIMDVNK